MRAQEAVKALISWAVCGVRSASSAPDAAPSCLPLPFGPLPDPHGAECASTLAAELASGAWPRARAPRVTDRVAGPLPPERGVAVGERRLSLMVLKLLVLMT